MSAQGPMFIPLPPSLAGLRAYEVEMGSQLEPYNSFRLPPGLPLPGKWIDTFLPESAMIEVEGCPKSFTVPPESVATRCSTDEPATPEAPLTPKDSDPSMLLEDEVLEELLQPSMQFDDAIQAALEPVLKEILGLEKQKGKGKEKAGGGARWWTRPTAPLLCPLTGFLTCLLPYPPFKLRVDPTRSTPHHLVDGKFLAVACIATGKYVACGRRLKSSDITALDNYIQRCKLGPYRPGRAVALAHQARNATTPEERAQAAQELEQIAATARSELEKVRRIQEKRLVQIKQALPSHLQAAVRFEVLPHPRRRVSSGSSGASTRASFNSICSAEN